MSRPQDEPNYDEYTLAELYDAGNHVDRRLYPERARRIAERVRWLEAQGAAAAGSGTVAPPPDTAVSTARDGEDASAPAPAEAKQVPHGTKARRYALAAIAELLFPAALAVYMNEERILPPDQLRPYTMALLAVAVGGFLFHIALAIRHIHAGRRERPSGVRR